MIKLQWDPNAEPLQMVRFPNGELKVPTEVPPSATVNWKWETDADLIELMLFRAHHPTVSNLRIMYMPYSRMDRDENGGTRCSLRYIGKFIADMGWNRIEVLEPHSDMTLAFLGEHAVPINCFPLLRDKCPELFTPETVIMFPDAGAEKRYSKEEEFAAYPHIVGHKVRDFETGKILSYEIANAQAAIGKRVVIVDDLCSYGGTFMLAGNELKRFEPANISLFVTHCENSIFKGDIFKMDSPINDVITTNSLLTGSPKSKGLSGRPEMTKTTLTILEVF